MHTFWIPITAASLTVFASTYLLVRRFSSYNYFESSCITSTLHAVVAIAWTAYAAYADPLQEDDGESTLLQSAWLATSLGYYLVDTYICLFLTDDKESLVHHFACIYGQIASLVTNRCGYILVLNMLIAELSTPFLYGFRFFFAPSHPLHKACQAIFAVSFLVARATVAPLLAWRLLTSTMAPWLVKSACVMLLSLSYYWAALVVREIWRAVSPQPKLEHKD